MEGLAAGFGDCWGDMAPGLAWANAAMHVNRSAPESVAILQILWEIIGGVPSWQGNSRRARSPWRAAVNWLCLRTVISTRPILECRELGRELAGKPSRFLAQDINFSVEQAEVLGVIGASGAGKSTLLRLINRLDEPTQGSVFFKGEDYRGLETRSLRRSIGMVMQRAFLFPGTVAENIAFGPRQQGTEMTGGEIESLLAEVGLAGYGSRDALTLSGGEAQRVAITRALANKPEVLLLDEPTSALDEAARDSVQRLLEELIREHHLTCIWVTHSLEQARKMADRILVLEAGRIKAMGTAGEILPSGSKASHG